MGIDQPTDEESYRGAMLMPKNEPVENFFINFYDVFFFFFLQNIMGREEEWVGQLEVASWGWL
jgi:hypothetical protein